MLLPESLKVTSRYILELWIYEFYEIGKFIKLLISAQLMNERLTGALQGTATRSVLFHAHLVRGDGLLGTHVAVVVVLVAIVHADWRRTVAHFFYIAHVATL